MKKKVCIVLFLVAIVTLSILKQLLVYDLPIAANVALGIDDALMISMTKSITENNWIGDYGDAVISKGVTFPLILALSYFLKVDYISFITILFTVSCFCLVLVLSKKIKNKLALFLIFSITLFTPIMYSYQVMQRVYRNALIPSFAIMIISGYLYLFLSRNEEKYIKRIIISILTGIVLALFWYTREDSIWMIPFIIFISAATVFSILIESRKITKNFLKTLLIILIPIIVVLGYKNIICYQNLKHFGVYTVYNNEAYKKAMKSLKEVKKYYYYDNIDITTTKLQKISQVSGALANIYPRLIELVYGYSLIDSSPENGEVVNGWFPWALKGAMSEKGYYLDARKTNDFYNTLHAEIQNGLKNGTLEREDVKPDIVKELNKLFYWAGQTFKTLYKYDDITFYAVTSNYDAGFDTKYKEFAEFTGNKFIVYENDESIIEKYFENVDNYENEIKFKVEIINKLINIYRVLNAIVFSIGVILYVIFSIITIIQIFKKKFHNLEMWIVISGIVGAMLSLVFGIAYETAFNANVITAMYLSAAYPLMLIFGMTMIVYAYNKCVEYLKNKNTEINNEN